MSDSYTKPKNERDADEEKRRRRFGAALRRRVVDELGIEESAAPRWLAKQMEVRWQTAQFWFHGHTIPTGPKLARIAKIVGMDARALLGEIAETESDHEEYKAFLRTPEGKSMSPSERGILAVFHWPSDPTIADYRSLLSVLRANAERT